MKRTVVCVATTERYRRGMNRLQASIIRIDHLKYDWQMYDSLPSSWPSHEDKPYAFKTYALKQAVKEGAELVLWCDACVLPIRSLEPLWERIEREGYWFARNGWTNYQWTADSAYRDLFNAEEIKSSRDLSEYDGAEDVWLADARKVNKSIPHVVATSFGLNLKSDIGKAFLDEYCRLASETRAFCGPWINTKATKAAWAQRGVSNPNLTIDDRQAPCGPADVLGHRHDQTAASVIAWRLGMKLTDPPDVFAYPPGDERTILLADGSYE